uniref:Probable galactarate/D-glucarate transporter GudP n=1 Tax=Pseudomonas putida TaxID=303 RepID=GUDP_PSEPU|nr:RecName: Full=Probable galactarate/D-glucarate transporter GudP [Pseudomonas putida]AAA25867.1 glucarate dehydratase [Pseudomonas putida]
MQEPKQTRVRYLILLMLFLVTTINYADRATISIAGSSIQKDFGLDAVTLGYIFSAFGWAYVLGQIPGGWLLDRFGSKKVYAGSIFTWSLFTLLQGYIGEFGISTAVVLLFLLRFMVGLAEAPSFPGNARIVASWFPTKERGTASAIFNSAQYFATRAVRALDGLDRLHLRLAARVHRHGRPGHCVLAHLVDGDLRAERSPAGYAAEVRSSPHGGLVDLEDSKDKKDGGPKWDYIRQLLTNRMMMGIYLGQFCINALTYFFLTWFPVYLVQERGMTILKAGIIASLPAICGFLGGVLGGVISDTLLRRGNSLSVARKTPIVCGMVLSMSMIICNYVDADWMVVCFMALAFFGKAIGALGWAVVSDTSPKQIAGLSGGLFNTFGNLSSISTPIIIGYIIAATGVSKWRWSSWVPTHSFAAISYLFIVGEINRIELKGVTDEPATTAHPGELLPTTRKV